MRNLRVVVSYDGTRYYGFQTQPGGNTIQDIIQDTIKKLSGEDVRIIGSGRTDAGVHARGQVFNFHTDAAIPVERWAIALNTRLPSDIVIRCVDEVEPEFHSSYSAKRKTYRYSIDTNKFPDVFERRYRFHHPTPLSVEEMRKGLAFLVGEHDFSSFTSRRSTKTSHVRTVYEARIDASDGKLDLFISGSGFLYNMVRVITGTLLLVGEGKLQAGQVQDILEAQDRSAAGPTAMAYGLNLWEVEYLA
ncbi:tRNA pseudouridine(38-40) synthase TruA [Paenibacillus nasutitermitis]|uniref:tRNA pseudouridine synthase A n=1 Tax=Paenibacillus nasutitermitis TaxID=1652958 RepID=A0A916ZJB6_9BACL|nr:tRNA pseudouridine(38-40) synthase TruA [Paenibacillus nasutitermitis]GGE00779.1 tRNA pseudouridine synthase A [Paenibacillus nasutitermitis]